jgi:glycosyltransferase involved in cell wall biosynthesis
MIAHLGEEYHFKVVTRNTDYTDTLPYPGIVPDGWTSQQGFEGYYISRQRLNRKSIRHLLQSTAYDLVYINGIYSWYFSLLPLLLSRKHGKPVVVSARGMLSSQALGVKSLKKTLFLKMAQRLNLYNHVCFHATNEKEAGDIRSLFGKDTCVKIAPNLPVKMEHRFAAKIKKPGDLVLISIARISPEKNTLYALQTLKNLPQDDRTTIQFDMYGPVYDQDYWGECRKIIEFLPSNIHVNYHGSISREEISGKFNLSHFLLMPTRGENFGHTILESLQSGCPVIISDRTPWRKLENVVVSRKSQVVSERQEEEHDDRRRRKEDHSPQTTTHSEQAEGVASRKLQIVSRIQKGDSIKSAAGVGWDIPLEDPGKFTEIIQKALWMDQQEYEAMSVRAYEYAMEVSHDKVVVEKNRELFG